jgi:hypothetical protein
MSETAKIQCPCGATGLAGVLTFLILAALVLLVVVVRDRLRVRRMRAKQAEVIDRYAEMVGLKRFADETTGQLRARVSNLLLHPPPRPFTADVLEAMLRECVPEIGHVVIDSPGPGQIRAALFTSDWEPVAADVLARADAMAWDMVPATFHVTLYTPRWPRKPVDLS